MKPPNKWDDYHMSSYRPIGTHWSYKDLQKYRQWYFAWVTYIEKRCEVLQKPVRIFEIGSGIGAIATLLHDRGHEVVGSDISDLMVDVANKLCKPVRFIRYDIEKIRPLSKTADVVMGFEVLEHLPKLNQALKNIRMLLCKGGYFIGTCPYPYRKNLLDPTHVNVKYPRQWENIFQNNGFSWVKTYPMSFMPYMWRVHKCFNIVLPFRISSSVFVSTTLIVARK